MKTVSVHIARTLLLLLCLSGFSMAHSQGRVVINEYLPWPSNSCGSTSEFVELLNFGPGPADISCYVLTNGRYSITIPSNTILAPGQFYVIAGQDVLPLGCANLNATVQVDLNWNSCNCTNQPILPINGGFMPDGGGGNVHLVLMNPSQQIVDAVTRSVPVPLSMNLTTSGVNGQCSPLTFNLNNLNPSYETLGMSTGSANSFARRLDGDCGWVKDPQQSAGGTNNTPSSTTDINYDFNILNSSDCNGVGGRVSISVKHGDVNSIFPMNYTIAFDSNNDGIFDLNDSYTYGEDYSPPEVIIDNLPMGSYKVTIASSKGCYLQTFSFSVLPCYPVLPVKLVYFRKAATSEPKLEWLLNDVEHLQSVSLEKESNNSFTPVQTYRSQGWTGSRFFSSPVPAMGGRYRLKISMSNGSSFYSPVVDLRSGGFTLNSAGPNPVRDQLQLQLTAASSYKATYSIINAQGIGLLQGSLDIRQGSNSPRISVHQLPAGIYQLRVEQPDPRQQPISFRFVKH